MVDNELLISQNGSTGVRSGTALVAVDGSSASTSAAEIAVEIAAAQMYMLKAVNVVDSALVFEPYSDFGTELEDTASDKFPADELIARFEAQAMEAMRYLYAICVARHVPFVYDVVLGNVDKWIELKTGDASFLALGRRGRRHSGSGKDLGEHYKFLSPRLPIPLLIGGRPAAPLRRLLLAYDGSLHARAAFHWTDVLQRSLGAEVIVLTVEDRDTDGGEVFRQAKALLAPASRARYQFELRRGKPALEIARAAAECGADLLLMGKSHRRRTLLHPFGGNLLSAVLRTTDIPVFAT